MSRPARAVRIGAFGLVAVLFALLVYHFAAQTKSNELRLAVIWPHARSGTLSTASFRGRPTVLNFWASWCGPCRREADVLRRGALQTRGKIQFVGIDIHDATSDARAFLRRYRIPYIVARGNDAAIATYGVIGLPFTVYLDARGHVVARTVGQLTGRALTQNLARLDT